MNFQVNLDDQVYQLSDIVPIFQYFCVKVTSRDNNSQYSGRTQPPAAGKQATM